MMRICLTVLGVLMLAPAGFSQETKPLPSDDQVMLQLYIHNSAQDLRGRKDQLKTFIIETHVRSSRLDIAQKLSATGFSDDDIRDMLARPGFVDLFERIRTNQMLSQKVDTFLAQYLEPHYIEEQVMAKHQLLAKRWLELTKEQRMADALKKQHMIRTLQDKAPIKPMSFWQKMMKKWFGATM